MVSQQGVTATPLLWSTLLIDKEMESITPHIMTPFSQWAAHVRSLLAVTQDRTGTLVWVRRVEKFRVVYAKSRRGQQGYVPEPEHPSPEDEELELWTDYCDEPAKYGDDVWERWTELDTKLSAGPKRWRVAAYWWKRQEEVEVSERAFRREVAATRIQAAIRGYLARSKLAWRDCCMCLAHRVCPLRTEKGYMCRDCGYDGPYTDIVDYDEWNWYRASYVDETIPLKVDGR